MRHPVGLRASLTTLYWLAAADTLLNRVQAQDVIYGREASLKPLVIIDDIVVKLPALIESVIKKIPTLVAVELSVNIAPKSKVTPSITHATAKSTTQDSSTTTSSTSVSSSSSAGVSSTNASLVTSTTPTSTSATLSADPNSSSTSATSFSPPPTTLITQTSSITTTSTVPSTSASSDPNPVPTSPCQEKRSNQAELDLTDLNRRLQRAKREIRKSRKRFGGVKQKRQDPGDPVPTPVEPEPTPEPTPVPTPVPTPACLAKRSRPRNELDSVDLTNRLNKLRRERRTFRDPV